MRSIAIVLLAVPITGAELARDVTPPSYTDQGAVEAPADWRSWTFVEGPLTPEALRGDGAPYPGFHNLYVEPGAFEYFKKTGKWANGTQIAKELVVVQERNDRDDATGTHSALPGRGCLRGASSSLELAVKDTERHEGQPGGWAYYSFGHKASDYEKTTEVPPREARNSRGESSAETDFVLT